MRLQNIFGSICASAYNCCSATCFHFSKNVHRHVQTVIKCEIKLISFTVKGPLSFHCRRSSFYPSEVPPWDARPVSGAGVVHYHLLHRPRSVPTALVPAPLVTQTLHNFIFTFLNLMQILDWLILAVNHSVTAFRCQVTGS